MTYDKFCARVRQAERPEEWEEIAEFVRSHPDHAALLLRAVYTVGRYEMARQQHTSSGGVINEVDAQSFYDRREWPGEKEVTY